jgi:hypothetical protein
MSNAIIAQLSSDSIASALDITVTAEAPVLALCRKLIESSTYASSTPLDALSRRYAVPAGALYRRSSTVADGHSGQR